jgi:hypothetical protein
MDELFEYEVEKQLESLRQQVRFLEQQVALTKPPHVSGGPAKNLEWTGQSGTIGAMLPNLLGQTRAPQGED